MNAPIDDVDRVSDALEETCGHSLVARAVAVAITTLRRSPITQTNTRVHPKD